MLSTNPSMLKSTPRMVYTGAKNVGLGQAVYEEIPLPQHLPHCYFFSEMGPANPTLTTSEVFYERYGRKTTDPAHPYFNHATGMLNIFLDQGRTILAERVIPPNAKKAFLRLSVELIPTELPVYQRQADGRFVYSYNPTTKMNEPVVDTSKPAIIGWRVVWHTDITPYSTAGNSALQYGEAGGPINFRSGSTASNSDPSLTLGKVAGSPTQSKLYAIFDVEVATFGKHGNRLGLSIQALTDTSDPAINETIYQYAKSVPYRLRIQRLADNMLLPDTIPALDGDDDIMMILKDNVVHPVEQTPLSFSKYFIKAYGDPNSLNSKAGPFSRVKVYQDNLSKVLDFLTQGDAVTDPSHPVTGEVAYQTQYYAKGGDVDYSMPENRHMLNILTGVDAKGIPAFSFDVSHSDDFGGVRFDEDGIIYASGGDDGLVLDQYGHPDHLANLKLLDEIVRQKALNYGISGPNLLNIARYPASAYYDSGYSVDTKYALMGITARRKDVVVITGIHRVADFAPAIGNAPKVWGYVGQLEESEKRSVASNLYSNAQMIKESIVDGTGASRIAIIRGDSAPFDPRIPYNVPFTFDIAYKASQYMGSTSGDWDGRYAFDDETVKVLSYVGELDADENDLTEPQANRYWDVGTAYPLYWDTQSLFWPYLRTVHAEPSSKMTSLEFVFGTCTGVKEAYKVWAILVGSNLEEEQFVERSNQMIMDRLNAAKRFASKFRITVDTKITAADKKRKFSWTTEITYSGGDYKTVNVLKISAQSSDFTTSGQ